MSYKPKCFIRVSPGRPMGDDTQYHPCVDSSRMVTYRITLERMGPYLDYDVIHYDAYSRDQAPNCGFVDDETLSILLCPHPVEQQRASIKQVVYLNAQVLAECVFVLTIAVATLDSPVATPHFYFSNNTRSWGSYVRLSDDFLVIMIDFQKKTLDALDWNWRML